MNQTNEDKKTMHNKKETQSNTKSQFENEKTKENPETKDIRLLYYLGCSTVERFTRTEDYW